MNPSSGFLREMVLTETNKLLKLAGESRSTFVQFPCPISSGHQTCALGSCLSCHLLVAVLVVQPLHFDLPVADTNRTRPCSLRGWHVTNGCEHMPAAIDPPTSPQRKLSTRNHSILKSRNVSSASTRGSISPLDLPLDCDAPPFAKFVTPKLSSCKQFHDQWAKQTRRILMEDSSEKRAFISKHVVSLQGRCELTRARSDGLIGLGDEAHRRLGANGLAAPFRVSSSCSDFAIS
uniref:Uncharacterized protein n=1 Tax=Parascaris equorum TaxID=6256 RepID=A0A914SF67_PAREQ